MDQQARPSFYSSLALILAIILVVTGLRTYQLIHQTTGGDDLLLSDIPKSIMLLHGRDPYSVQPWSAPYPLLLFVVVASIIQVTSSSLVQSPAAIAVVDQNVRVAGIFASALVSIIIFLSLRFRVGGGIRALVPASLFVTLPAISITPLYWFHSDIFGYPILALSLFLLTRRHYFAGTNMLAAAAIYKVHPILTLPLVLVWLARRHGLKETLPVVITSTTVVSLGLILPFMVPGYTQAMVSFNLANTGTGTNTFSILNLLYGILPSLGFKIATTITNGVWIASTAVLFVIILQIVWRHADSMDPIQCVLLGLTVWLIPLKMLFTPYMVWAFIPIFMLGKFRQAIFLAGILQAADTLAYWSYFPIYSPILALGSVYGFFITSLVYLMLSVLTLRMALKFRNTETLARPISVPQLSPLAY